MSARPRRRFGAPSTTNIETMLDQASLERENNQEDITSSPTVFTPTPPDSYVERHEPLDAVADEEIVQNSLPRSRSGRKFFGSEPEGKLASATPQSDIFSLLLDRVDKGDTEDENNQTDDVIVSPNSPMHSPNQDIPSEMKCPICLDPFDCPVTLSCNHNVCSGHILDLAAADSNAYNGPTDAFTVRCPKCRSSTVFAEGQKSIHVNHEMKAVVDMILRLLANKKTVRGSPSKDTSPVPSQPPSPRGLASSSSQYNPNSVDVAPPALRSRSQSEANLKAAKAKKVKFEGDDTENESKGTRATTPATSEGEEEASASPAKTPTSATRHRQHIKNAQNQLLSLEKQLELQRVKLKSDREDAARQKVEDYKRSRQEEINRRKQLLMVELEEEERLAAEQGKDVSGYQRELYSLGESPKSPLDGNVWPVAEAEFLELKRQRELRKELERDRREQVVQSQIEAWKNKDYPIIANVDGDELERHLREIDLYSTGKVALSLTAKAKAAEAETELLFREEQKLKLQQPVAKPPLERTPPKMVTEFDDEVERKMWEVELKVNRERDEELSRAKMAEIAEQRARATIAAYLGNSVKKPTTPSYTPKLQRLQKI